MALERVDLRHNKLDESAEVGRLSVLPHIAEVWVEGNPFVTLEENYRVHCFDYFLREGKQVMLDGSLPGFYERRSLTTVHIDQSRPLQPPPRATYSPPVVAASSSSSVPVATRSSPQIAPSGSPSVSAGFASPVLTAVAATTPKSKRKKNKRIVALDGGESDYRSSEDGGRRSGPHSRRASEAVVGKVHAPIVVSTTVSRPPVSNGTVLSTPLSAEPESTSVDVVPPSPQSSSSSPTSGPETTTTTATTNTSSSQPNTAFTPTTTETPKRTSRHSRYHSEVTPSISRSSTSIPNLPNNTNGTLSKSSKRASRISASVYEPSSPSINTKSSSSSSDKDKEGANAAAAAAQLRDASAFRAKMEALRVEMGDNWLQVLSQTQFVQSVGMDGKRG